MIISERISEILKFKEMIYSWTRKELRVKYKGTFLGFLWSFANPLLQVMVYSAIFPYIMRYNQENFPLFLFSALIPWEFFSSTLRGSCGLMISNASLVTKVYFPREVLPIAFSISGLFNMIFSYVVLIPLLLIFRVKITWNILWLPVLMAIITVLCTGIAMLMSAVNVFFRDMEYMLGIMIMALYFLSPVMYNITFLPEHLQQVMLICNPAAGIIVLFRNVTFFGLPMDFHILGIAVFHAVLFLTAGYAVFLKLQRGFAEAL